ncbi:MAG: TIM barrel protein [Clostridia bacterium]|nr:TIM barrel protein [Clostridia bacterium]
MVLFGPSGCGEEFVEEGHSGILEVPAWIKAKGLDAYEYSFGHGYQMSTEKAQLAGEEFKKHDIKLSLHAPFYINFANPDEEMYAKTQGYIYTGIKFLRAFGADRLIFHAASCGKLSRDEALALTKARFIDTFDKMEQEGLLDDLILCPETMGKTQQIGTYQEIVDLCTLNKHLLPTFDFGHINSLEGGSLKTKDDYKRILDYSIEKIGYEKTNNCHIHFSKIQYGAKGEIKHLNYDDLVYGPEFDGLAEILIEYNLSPRVICESMSTMPKDALIMKKIYHKMLDK